jgi:thiol-disulfide isomerase/thioredoxin
MPNEIVPDRREIRPDSFAPIRPTDPSDSDSDAPSRSPVGSRRRQAPSPPENRSARYGDASDEASTANPRAGDRVASKAAARAASPPLDTAVVAAAASAPARRPTWRDLALNPSEVPVDEAVRRAANATEANETKIAEVNSPKAADANGPMAPAVKDQRAPGVNDREVVTLTGSTNPPRLTFLQRFTRQKPASAVAAVTSTPAAEASQSLCRIDPTDRRLVELRLPNLDGNVVSIKDLDADLILLDFWGSWCKECRRSIPHLAELQSRYGDKRLRVIGVACERGSSLKDRQSSAAQAARGLKIDYPVLISNMDGTCPVQKGMQIQFYPTMVLVDRSGRIIHREQGATDATLARIDRSVAAALKQ